MLYRWIVPDSLDVFPTHVIPEAENWYIVMNWIWSDDGRPERFVASILTALDHWKEANG